jgi:hypothetical protein
VIGASEWTSLEVAKLVVGALVPVLLFALGIVVSRAARRVEESQWASRKVIERRLELYDEMAPKLNDLFCFFHRVGHYKEIDPPGAVARKRELDKTFYANAPLFSTEFRQRYRAFLNACFLTYTGAGEDAKLRTSPALQRHERPSWKDEWDEMFAWEDTRSDSVQIGTAFDALMDSFSQEVGAKKAERRPRA